MPIHTVLGPIEPDELGPTSMHEHLLSDLRIWSRPSAEEPPSGVPIGPELLGYLRWNALSVPENLVLHDPDTAVAELRDARAAGASAVVELTLEGMGRRLAELPEISRRSGVHLCVGGGFYVDQVHPGRVRAADVDGVAEMLLAELRDGIGGTGIRPALLGEIGTSWPVTDGEWKVLRAAGRAGAESGAAVYVHLSFRGKPALPVFEALVAEGMDPSRIIIGHLDEYFDPGYHREVARTGAVLAYDTFGSDFLYGGPEQRNPTDAERIAMVEWLLEEGYAGQLIIGADVWTQANLKRNGGYGYDHLFRRIAPAITRVAGGDASVVERILVTNPRRLLNRP
ncbi:phosphotriesterase-related protein [Actinocorallia herbida]|uniref:Phosphotriesterase-related protein n=1 Tax=Actinocorallia herbida TaxID=58109 RepID=A0A3N1D6M9_9ACTN|nr:phosphotriesterase [Actinocorallia herbida]ROO89119.1 phosphotriesterase-related protein [Actinocorallia herbida]